MIRPNRRLTEDIDITLGAAPDQWRVIREVCKAVDTLGVGNAC